ncbi:MAG: hypothetical protein IPG52_15715 [Rhodocyclaceae bacterium]|nr:hypothetical protein [Rhodocyclaceae bacterium]
MTGALNRKGMDEAIEREVARARRKNLPPSVALLDIDNSRSSTTPMATRSATKRWCIWPRWCANQARPIPGPLRRRGIRLSGWPTFARRRRAGDGARPARTDAQVLPA